MTQILSSHESRVVIVNDDGSIEHLEEVTGSGHVIGAVYRSAYWGGLYKVIDRVGEYGVLVECVFPGHGAHQVPGTRWQHCTKLDPKDRRIS